MTQRTPRRKWTRAEIDILRSEFHRRPTAEIAIFVRHPVASVRRKAHDLGLKRDGWGIRWEPWMTDLLKQHYATTRDALLSQWLGVGKMALMEKAKQLDLKKEGPLHRPKRKLPDGTIKKIGPAEDIYIREHVTTSTMASIAQKLGYAKCTVTAYCKKKGITKTTPR